MKNSFLYTIIFTFILCFFFVLILSFTNNATKDRILANRKFAEEKAILVALGVDKDELEDKAAVDSKFTEVEEVQKGSSTYYEANFTGTPALAKRFTGPGLWGLISGYIAFSEDLSQAIGFEVTDQNETPGLGARISEDWFTEQFKNEKVVNNKILVLKSGSGDEDKENGSIDGISGATRTSDGIQVILDQELATFQKDIGR